MCPAQLAQTMPTLISAPEPSDHLGADTASRKFSYWLRTRSLLGGGNPTSHVRNQASVCE